MTSLVRRGVTAYPRAPQPPVFARFAPARKLESLDAAVGHLLSAISKPRPAPPLQLRMPIATRSSGFTESVMREMSRGADQYGAINLAQGFPDFPMPAPMKDAACTAIHGDINQYAVTWGTPVLRVAIAEKYRRWYDMDVDPDRNVTVTCGATEAMASVFMALMDAGDEVIVLEPFYENYGPDAILAGATPV